jgi:hypothetical protein
MAANDEFIHVWKEGTDGTKNLQVLQKIDSDFGANGIEANAIPGTAVDLGADLVAADVAPVAAPTIVGTPAVPVQLEVVVAAGATADVGTFVMPWKARLVNIEGYKTAANGGAGDLFEVEDTAGGAGVNIASLDLNVSDTAKTNGVINDAANNLAAGATIHFRRVTVTDGACNALLTFIRHV